MLCIQVSVIEDAGLQQIVAKPRPLLQMPVNRGMRPLKYREHYLAVAVTTDAVPGPAVGEHALLPDLLDLGEDVSVFGGEDSLENPAGIILQVGHRLLDRALRRHVHSLDYHLPLKQACPNPPLHLAHSLLHLLLTAVKSEQPHQSHEKPVFFAF